MRATTREHHDQLKLNEQQRYILIEHHLTEKPTRLEALARRYPILRERVHRIEVSAIQKLQNAIVPGAARQLLAG